MKKTALNTYLGDMIQGRIARIPSSSDDYGLEYIPIPIHQAQIGVVSSAGMTINANSMALVQNGTLFLQDGMSNATSYQYIDRTLYFGGKRYPPPPYLPFFRPIVLTISFFLSFSFLIVFYGVFHPIRRIMDDMRSSGTISRWYRSGDPSIGG
jgi:hypothetical protein